MTAITWTNVTDIAAELATVSVAEQNAILAYVNNGGIAVAAFRGESTPTTFLARSYLAAHMAAMSRRGVNGSSGTITAASEGNVAEHYASPDGINGSKMLSETPYGRLYTMLMKRSFNSRGPLAI